MYTSLSIPLASSLAFRATHAHFTMPYPPSIGFNDEKEGDVPCGGFNDFSNATSYSVQDNVVALVSSHPQASWAIRAQQFPIRTGNWTNLLPYISESGIGSYCPTGINVPASWAGSKGVIQVVQGGPDGTLHQCAAVNFVSGKAGDAPSSCKNGTDLKASFVQDATFSSVMATETAAPTDAVTASSGASSSTSAAAASATSARSSSAAVPRPLSSVLWIEKLGLYVQGGLFAATIAASATLFL